ncbi:MAG: hypothetical protein LAT68_03345 [Cyclobacteriaceae bacterium]|nr:hypothetical protein [Cyclobacteriaceae bacterium]MCH8515343.1 hypothetical protein [Cyclobacteriaceae bacterium]
MPKILYAKNRLNKNLRFGLFFLFLVVGFALKNIPQNISNDVEYSQSSKDEKIELDSMNKKNKKEMAASFFW